MLTTTKPTRIDNARGGRHYRVEGFAESFPIVTTALSVKQLLFSAIADGAGVSKGKPEFSEELIGPGSPGLHSLLGSI